MEHKKRKTRKIIGLLTLLNKNISKSILGIAIIPEPIPITNRVNDSWQLCRKH